MAHHHHGPLLRERSHSRIRERFYARPERDSSTDTGPIHGSGQCRCSRCQTVVVRGRPAQQENVFFQGAARMVHQNIIQQNINLAPEVRGVRRRASRPVILAADDDYDDQRGGARSRHAGDNRWYQGYREEDEIHDTDEVTEYAWNAREAMKRRKHAKEVQEMESALAERNQFFARQHHAPPAQSRHRATEDILRELEECDNDLKRCYEEAARDARFRGRVVELENARRKHEEAEKAKKKPLQSILVKKRKVNFKGSVDMRERFCEI